ncbi:MAG: hypothetical protein BWY05_01394 [Euryarchaeota archaeon ADurb.Bin165]|nr:MAG: hypothetical protein BWY05_01394 [Euryarchaeota archaeon ADurb.Bin165]
MATPPVARARARILTYESQSPRKPVRLKKPIGPFRTNNIRRPVIAKAMAMFFTMGEKVIQPKNSASNMAAAG